MIKTLNDLSSQIKTDFGGYKLISKLFIFGLPDKIKAKNEWISKFYNFLCMSQQLAQF